MSPVSESSTLLACPALERPNHDTSSRICGQIQYVARSKLPVSTHTSVRVVFHSRPIPFAGTSSTHARTLRSPPPPPPSTPRHGDIPQVAHQFSFLVLSCAAPTTGQSLCAICVDDEFLEKNYACFRLTFHRIRCSSRHCEKGTDGEGGEALRVTLLTDALDSRAHTRACDARIAASKLAYITFSSQRTGHYSFIQYAVVG